MNASTRRRLARLAAREQKTRDAHSAAAEEFRAAVTAARDVSTVREIAEATGRSFQRIAQIAPNRRARRI